MLAVRSREDGMNKGTAAASGGGGGGDGYSLADVAKHTTKNDCRVVVNREVLNVTSPSTLSGCRFSPRAAGNQTIPMRTKIKLRREV